VPYFSIITCTCNAGKTLASCIESVENQLCDDFEHLFIDGFSTDETVSIILKYQARCPGKVRLHQLEPTGVTRAMNEAVAISKGAVVLHLHGDDRLAGPDVLGSVKELFDRSRATVVVGNCLLTGNSDLTQTWPKNPMARAVYKALIPVIMFHLNPIPHPSTYLSRSVFDRHGGFDEEFKVVMDYDYWFRIIGKERFLITDRILSIYRFHSDTISTRQKELGLREINRIHVKYQTEYPILHFLYTWVLRPLLLVRKALRGAGNSSLTRSEASR
jgi:glycosyltransferase involved in cell wall biosynthesis